MVLEMTTTLVVCIYGERVGRQARMIRFGESCWRQCACVSGLASERKRRRRQNDDGGVCDVQNARVLTSLLGKAGGQVD